MRRVSWFRSSFRLKRRSAAILFFGSILFLIKTGPADSRSQSAAPDLRDANLVLEGEMTFIRACSVPYCHGKEGTAGRAPALRDHKWEVNRLRRIITEGVPNTSMLNFDDKLTEREIWGLVAYILSISGEAPPEDVSAKLDSVSPRKSDRSADLPPASSVPKSLTGDPAQGEVLFFESSGERGCAGCHSIDGKGMAVGPDLSGYSRRSAREIFRKIVFPGDSLDPGRGALLVTMNDGEKITAIKHEETPTGIRVFDVSTLPPVLRRLAKDQIRAIEQLQQSGMPERYAELYSLRELLDIVSFLKSSGAASPVRVTFLDIQ